MKLTQSPRSPFTIERKPAHTVLSFYSDEVGPVTVYLDPLHTRNLMPLGTQQPKASPTHTPKPKDEAGYVNVPLIETPPRVHVGRPVHLLPDTPRYSHPEPSQLIDGPAPTRIPHKPDDSGQLAALKDEYNTGRIEFAEYLERSRGIPVHTMPEDDRSHRLIPTIAGIAVIVVIAVGVLLL